MERSGSCENDDLKRQRNWEQFKVPGLHPSMSMSDLMNHIGNRISEQMTSGNPALSEGVECQDILEDIAQYLLSDSQFTASSDEKSLMSRVNSLCCLLQKDPGSVQNLQQMNGESCLEGGIDEKKDVVQPNHTCESVDENRGTGDMAPEVGGESKDVTGGYKQAPGMSRKDSFGDLLLHLPRITSLPKFLFNITEDDENQAR